MEQRRHAYVVFASSASLALLETLAHLPSHLASADFCLLRLEFPDKFIQKISNENLPANWNALPFSYTSQKLGNTFIAENKFLALQIPSAIMEIENNILLNPSHPHFNQVKIISQEKTNIDKRLKQ